MQAFFESVSAAVRKMLSDVLNAVGDGRLKLAPYVFGDRVLTHLPGGKPGQKGVTCAPGTLANLPKASS